MALSVVQALVAFGEWVQRCDMALFHAVNLTWAHPVLDPILVLATQVGLGHTQLALLLLLYVLGGPAGRRTALYCVLAFAASGIAAQILKSGVDRMRPTAVMPDCRLLIERIKFHSFPSGHTATSFAIAVVVAGRHRKWALPALFMAALVGYSRVYVGVHWPSDVLTGCLVGIATGVACLHEERRRRPAAPGPSPEAEDEGLEPAVPAGRGEPAGR